MNPAAHTLPESGEAIAVPSNLHVIPNDFEKEEERTPSTRHQLQTELKQVPDWLILGREATDERARRILTSLRRIPFAAFSCSRRWAVN